LCRQILAIGVSLNSSKELKAAVGKDGKFNTVNSYDDLEKIDSWVMKHVCKPGKVPIVTTPAPPTEREYTAMTQWRFYLCVLFL